MKKKIGLLLFISIFLIVGCSTVPLETSSYWENCNFMRASERSSIFVNAINKQNPEIIYSMLTEDYKSKIDKEEFCRRYNDDLTYPYISPLYCYLQRVDLHYDTKGVVSCKVASRLIGEKFTFSIAYEKGDYYFLAFADIIDNSYREKFKNMVVKWI